MSFLRLRLYVECCISIFVTHETVYPTAEQAAELELYGLAVPTLDQVKELLARAERNRDPFTRVACDAVLRGSKSAHLVAVAMCF